MLSMRNFRGGGQPSVNPLPPTKRSNLPGWDHHEAFQQAISKLAGALEDLASRFPEARVDQPGPEPREPEFFATALRVPGDEDTGLRPVMLVYVLSPDWFSRKPTGLITFVAAIGYPAAAIGMRRFLRTWHEGRLGGETVYEGDLTEDGFVEPSIAAAERFFQRRKELSARAQELSSIAVWPITGYAPRLCTYCLVPAGQGVCPRCGKPVLAVQPGRPEGP
mgnify:CR=1 FL=1